LLRIIDGHPTSSPSPLTCFPGARLAQLWGSVDSAVQLEACASPASPAFSCNGQAAMCRSLLLPVLLTWLPCWLSTSWLRDLSRRRSKSIERQLSKKKYLGWRKP